MNNYRINKLGLLDKLAGWDSFIKRKVHLIACGGTAMTLLGIKESTKDIDLIVPAITEYNYLIRTLPQLGYKQVTGAGWARDDGFVFDLFRGERVFTTGLIESPLGKQQHVLVREFNYIYLGVLNYYDIIITKLFRGTQIDNEDCLMLLKVKQDEIDLEKLKNRFFETASYDVSENNVIKNWEHFIRIVKKQRVV